MAFIILAAYGLVSLVGFLVLKYNLKAEVPYLVGYIIIAFMLCIYIGILYLDRILGTPLASNDPRDPQNVLERHNGFMHRLRVRQLKRKQCSPLAKASRPPRP